MTGRDLHDALLRVLTSAARRTRLQQSAGEDGPEAEVFRRADPARLGRLARFLARHFYRERIVRLFVASRRLAREQGWDPLALLEAPAFDRVLAAAAVGSAATADAVATLVEAPLLKRLREPHAQDLVAYEGALFRTEAGPRRWQGIEVDGEVPIRSRSARVITLEWDVTSVVAAARRGDASLPAPPRGSTRLLIALSGDGRVTTARCGDSVLQVLDALDGTRSSVDVAGQVGLGEADARRALRQLAEVGAVEWRARAAT